MLKCLCLIALLPLPTWEYKIKVEGKLDIGNQIADFLKELRSRVVEQRMRAMREGKVPSEPGPTDRENTEQAEDKKDVPLLEEMINKGQQKIHIYGTHKSEKKERNNVRI